ncbi:hypothetical protein FOQG_08694 [Fusarium oxysporum f. sp. raphani 54005]|uniref:Uncharacterized protein n=7 Tax=Fusarium oxysporum TaxID=5507 RepID=X0CAD2_FUSOX|nr:hypothetical protein FOXG_19152 [Fusarium oxysporum f. sp. lycopersici 4287]EWZ42816.1 hypothetical protein FOZG_07628 [Fusarium oxysporum Fo47]EXA00094.1 hypothetical protein FOWG_00422 [Fusarium oxysporum f. sp. lycopersici MN25]EXA46905.1 hypothetical protein FOVG_04194 [Fusarium oxysporum f. sp. pisi HDV247]EXK33071.1 hypothetical protein FOMG_11856 [Fusarium oxysporum f. sp. melonis 26406]EXK87794.1 hypothetical protein FOQG_08694 [Fusarium oxysporum f. sp. raphani 54005]EXL58772.1 hy
MRQLFQSQKKQNRSSHKAGERNAKPRPSAEGS